MFWKDLPKPIMILAPLEDVTDTVFRRIILEETEETNETEGTKGDSLMSRVTPIFFTEFTNADGMFSKGDKEVSKRLLFDPIEKPVVAQIWGITPEHYYHAAKRLVEMGFDGIDINMGCPEKSVTSKGACSALIKNHSLAKEIILATREGAAGKLPVSVKTRLGFSEIVVHEWIGFLLSLDLPVLTVHGRTVKEMSKVPAHWDEIGNVVKLRDEMKKDTLIFGNGDVKSLAEAREKVSRYGVDGVMIGRGIFENPWLFNESVEYSLVMQRQKIDLLLKHLDLFEQVWGNTKPFQVLKKYFKMYISGFEGASQLRAKLMETKTYDEARKVVSGISNF